MVTKMHNNITRKEQNIRGVNDGRAWVGGLGAKMDELSFGSIEG